MGGGRLGLAPLAAAVVLGCSAFGGAPGPDHCKIQVLRVEKWDVRSDRADVSYLVKGEAGSAAVVWLAGKTGAGRYLTGGAVDVGPGPFQAIVDLNLTGVPREYVAILEVAGHRCRAEAKKP